MSPPGEEPKKPKTLFVALQLEAFIFPRDICQIQSCFHSILGASTSSHLVYAMIWSVELNDVPLIFPT